MSWPRFTKPMACALWLAGAWLSSAHASRFAEIAPERVASLIQQLPEKPSGLGPACQDRSAWGRSDVQRRLQDITKAAEKIAAQPVPAWDDEAYLDYSRNGVRGNGERIMNARKAGLHVLVLAECSQWAGSYLPAISRLLQGLSTQPTWTWPAHDKDLRNFRGQRFEVDLFAADTANELAQTLYLLGDKLDGPTRKMVRDAVMQRVLAPVRASFEAGGKDHWWLKADHNWNAVCLKGVTGTALAMLPDREDRAVFVAGAEHYIRNYLGGFPPDGYALEGPGYWNYGFSHYTELREMLTQATAGRLDLFDHPLVREVALYGYRFEMTPGNVELFGDAGRNTRMDDTTRAYANEAYGLGQPQTLFSQSVSVNAPANSSPLVQASIKLFSQPAPAGHGSASAVGLQTYFNTVGVLVSRPGSGETLGFAFKAGGNGNHSHNDVGSYTIALGAEQPVGDAGATVYSSKTFSKDRFTIRGINSWGHPVPVMAGQLQRESTKVKAPVLEQRGDVNGSMMRIDMKPAYAVESLQKLERSAQHIRGPEPKVIIEDAFRFSTPQTFESAIISTGQFQRVADDTLDFWQKQEHLRAKISASQAFELQTETVTEEGLTFNRTAIRLLQAATGNAWVRMEFTPAPR